MIERYVELGWKLIQLHGSPKPGVCTCKKGAGCDSAGKHPVKGAWQNEWSTDIEEIEGWIEEGYNLGVILGPASGIIDIEIDGPEAAEFWGKLGIEAWTPTAQAARGPHRFFKYDERLPKATIVKPGGLEIRIGNAGMACQSVIPPSRHSSGAIYQWVMDPADCEPQELPEALIHLCRSWEAGGEGTGVGRASGRPADILTEGAGEGERNHKLFAYAIKLLHEQNLSTVPSVEGILEVVKAVNQSKCDPPLPDREVVALFDSAYKCASRTQKEQAEGFGMTEHDRARMVALESNNRVAEAKADRAVEELADAEAAYNEASERYAAAESALPEEEHRRIYYMGKFPDEKLEYRQARAELRKARTAKQAAERRAEKAEESKEIWSLKQKSFVEAIESKQKPSDLPTDEAIGFFGGMGLIYDQSRKGFDKGDWSLRIIKADPPIYALRVPAWGKLLEGVGGEVRMDADTFMSADKMAKAVMGATGTISLDIFGNNIWAKAWIGSSRSIGRPRKNPSSPPLLGLRAQLMLGDQLAVDAAEDTEQHRYVVVARHILDQMHNASQPTQSDSPDPSGRPQWRSDGTLWFQWARVWEEASKFRKHNDGDLRGFQTRLLSACGLKAFRNETFTTPFSGERSYCVWNKEKEFAALQRLANSA